MIVFLIPVRHEDSVEDYEQIWGLLNNTLASIAAQDCPQWHAFVCANKVLPISGDLPQRQITFIESRRNQVGDLDFDAHLLDKAERRRICVERAQKMKLNPQWYFMADADDYLATDLVSTILNTTELHHSMVTIDTGIMIDVNKQSYVTINNFNDICGTSIAMHHSLVHSCMDNDKHINHVLGTWKFNHLLAGKACRHHNRHSLSGISRVAYVRHSQNYGSNLWNYDEILASAEPLTHEIRERFTLPRD